MSCACVQESREQERERENSQRNEQGSYIFMLPQKQKNKLHLLNLTPSDLWQELYHICSTQTYHLCLIIGKLLVHHSVQIIVSDAQWPFHIVQLSQTSDLRTTMLFTRMSIVESDVNIFWYSWGRYKDYTSDGHTAMSADWVIKARVPASTDLGPNCQTI